MTSKIYKGYLDYVFFYYGNNMEGRIPDDEGCVSIKEYMKLNRRWSDYE